MTLRSGDRWLAPDDTGYVPAFREINPAGRAAWWFVAGGFVVESAIVLGATTALSLVVPVLATVWLATSS